MAVRESPNYVLEGLSVYPYTLGCLDIDFPLDTLSPSIKPMTKQLDSYNETLKELYPQDDTKTFPKERQRVNRKTRFNQCQSYVSKMYLAAQMIDPSANQKQFEIIKAYLPFNSVLIDTRAVYSLMCCMTDFLGAGGDLSNQVASFVSAAFHNVKGALITPESEKFRHLKDPRRIAELIAPVTMSVLKINNWRKRMHGLRKVDLTRLKMPVKDSFQLTNCLKRIMQLKIRSFGLAASYFHMHGTDNEYSMTFRNIMAAVEPELEELENLEEKVLSSQEISLEMADMVDRLEAKMKQWEAEIKHVLEVKSLEHGMFVIHYSSSVALVIAPNFVALNINRKSMLVLTEKQLYECEVLLSEFAASITSIAQRDSIALAEKYRQTMLTTWQMCSMMSYDTCNYATCLQREYEMHVCNLGDIGSAETFPVGDHGPYSDLISLWDKFITNDKGRNGPLAKALRTMRQFAFEPITLYNEHHKCFTLVIDPPKKEIELLRLGVRYAIQRFHSITYGELHPDVQYAIAHMDHEKKMLAEAGSYVGHEIFIGLKWNGFGAKGYTEEIDTVKDSTNIPPDNIIHREAGAYKKMTAFQNREVLYYSKIDPKEELLTLKSSLQSDAKMEFPIRLTVKPEQKEGGRTITMECSQVRRANTIIQSNCLPISKTFWGSLMGKAAPSKFQSIQTMLQTAHNAVTAGFGVLFIQTDFKKFGHTISHLIDEMLLSELSDYWGQEWVKKFLNTLKNSIMSSGYMGSEVCFDNTKMADGQGMRNAMWQMMLMAIPFCMFDDIYNSMDEISKERPIAPIFFMDDHVLMITYTKQKDMSLSENSQMIFRKIMPMLKSVYDRLKLQLEDKKTTASPYGFGLLGDIFDMAGIVSTPTKGVATSFRPSKMNAPSIANLINDTNSSVMSGVMTGAHPNDAWAISLFALAHKIASYTPRLFNSYMDQFSFLVFLPQELGGWNFPLPQHINMGMGYAKDIDMLYCLWLSLCDSGWKGQFVNRLLLDAMAEKTQKISNIKKVFVNPTMVPIISGIMSRKFSEIYSIDIDSMLRDRDEKVKEALESIKQVPPTLALALNELHPVSQWLRKMEKVSESSTARELAGKKEVYMSGMAEKTRLASYMARVTMHRTDENRYGIEFASFMQNFIGTNVHKPLTTPTRFLMIPIHPGQAHGNYTLSLRTLTGQAPVNFLLGTQPRPDPVDITPLPHEGEFGRLKTLHSLVYAHTSEYGQTSQILNKKIQKVAKTAYSSKDFRPSGDPVTYRDVQTVAYSRSVSAPWVGNMSTKIEPVHDDLSEITDKTRQHYNYNMAILIAYLSEEVSHNFIFGRGGLWSSPDISSQQKDTSEHIIAENLKKYYEAVNIVTASKKPKAEGYFMNERAAKTAKEMFLETIQTEIEIQQMYKNSETAFEDAPPVADFITVMPETISAIETISSVMPKEASKLLWAAWVSEVYSSLCMRKVPVMHLISGLPAKFNSFNLNIANQRKIMEQLTPNKKMFDILEDKARRMNCYNEMLNWFRRVWVGIIKTSLTEDFRSVKGAAYKIISTCPAPYIKQLRATIPMITVDNLVEYGTAKFTRFCRGWCDRYLHQMMERAKVLEGMKRMYNISGMAKGHFLNDGHKAMYCTIHEMKLMALLYRQFAENTEFTQAPIMLEASASIAIANLIIRDAKKYKVGDFSNVEQFIAALRKKKLEGKADAIEIAVAFMVKRLILIATDLNLILSFDPNKVEINRGMEDENLQKLVSHKHPEVEVNLDNFVLTFLGAVETTAAQVGSIKKIHGYSERDLVDISEGMKMKSSEERQKDVSNLARSMVAAKRKKKPRIQPEKQKKSSRKKEKESTTQEIETQNMPASSTTMKVNKGEWEKFEVTKSVMETRFADSESEEEELDDRKPYKPTEKVQAAMEKADQDAMRLAESMAKEFEQKTSKGVVGIEEEQKRGMEGKEEKEEDVEVLLDDDLLDFDQGEGDFVSIQLPEDQQDYGFITDETQ